MHDVCRGLLRSPVGQHHKQGPRGTIIALRPRGENTVAQGVWYVVMTT